METVGVGGEDVEDLDERRAADAIHAEQEIMDQGGLLEFKITPEDKPVKVHEIDLAELHLLTKIGSGSYGQVYLGMWHAIEVAVKRVDMKEYCRS